jgi:N-glycosylase/DNA lyase
MFKRPLKKEINSAKDALRKFIGSKSDEDRFYELCFAICSPQVPIENNIDLNGGLKAIDFYNKGCPEDFLITMCSKVRFKNRKAQFLQEAREIWLTFELQQKIDEIFQKNEREPAAIECRELLVKRIGGLGYKTASHFLRNAYGVMCLAIIDTHVLQAMIYANRFHYTDQFKLNRDTYLFLEKDMRKWAKKLKTSIAILDAILFIRGSGCGWNNLR